jgi:diguanylate cyclase (GGDEF)-like protein
MRLTTRDDRVAVQIQPSPQWASALVVGSLLLLSHWLTLRYGESDLIQIALFLAVGVVTAKLTLKANHLCRLAMTDDLTGLHNLRSFEARLATMVRASREQHARLALLVVDVDRLKSLNDQYGHLAGAEAVRTVGRILGRQLPPDAVACRYGGDEFVIALPRCTPLLVHRVASDLCRAVHDSAPVLSGRSFAAGTLSISVGGACASFDHIAPSRAMSPGNVEAGEWLFRAADSALYRAKAAGRNQVCVTRSGHDAFDERGLRRDRQAVSG